MAADAHPPLPDADARRRAATDFRTNLVVRAGAGTGKTSLLIERALNAIGSGVATMESIAAITFTEKAAGEMRERLAIGLDRLRSLARDRGALDEAREADRAFRHLVDSAGIEPHLLARRALEAMEQLDHGTVVTIHRFCAELLRAHPLEAGVDPGFVVDSGEWASSLGGAAWKDFVKVELGARGPRADEWERLLPKISLKHVGAAALQLAGFGVPPALLEPAGSDGSGKALQDEACRIANELDVWLEERAGDLPGTATRCFRSFRTVLESMIADGVPGARQALAADSYLANRVDSGNLGSTSKRAGEAAAKSFKVVRSAARDFCKGIRCTDDQAIERLLEIVRPFTSGFREQYLRQGRVSFDGLLALARDLLRDHPEVRRGLKRRYALLLVDEFQDTDPLQYEIVLLLAEQVDDEAGDAFRARLAPGRLFVVGDAKQSIYRFRGADFAAYRRAIDRILECGGVQLDLVSNFRSVPGIVEPVNELFGDANGCWRASAYQPDYVAIRAVREPADEATAVDLWTVELPRGTRADDRREAEGRVIAETIERWVETEKRLEYENITILFRAFTQISYYLRPLRERGIPFVVDGGRDFLKRPEIGQLVATLQALSRPADQPALLAFLRSPAGGVSDVELARYAKKRQAWRWQMQPDSGEFPGISRSFRLLRELSDEARQLPVDRLVRLVLDRTLMLPLGASAFEGAQRVANLQKLVAAAGELARDGTLSLEEVLEALEEGRLEDIQTDRPLADDAAQAVRITSIHRMKGLENDVIIVPDLARERGSGEYPSDPVRVTVLPDGQTSLAIKADSLQNSVRLWYGLEDERHGTAEEVRVLYVALTRARQRLILVAAPARGTTPWLESLAPWGYEARNPPADGALLADGRVRHRCWKPPARQKPPEKEIPEAATRAVQAYDEAVEALRKAATKPFTAPSGLGEERQARLGGASGSLPPRVRQSRDLGQAVGIVLHRLLESWDGQDPQGLSEHLAALCEQTSRETRTDPGALGREAGEILEGFLKSELATRFPHLDRLGAEVPVLMQQESTGQTMRGSIDLLYKDASGQLVVADYKTDRETDPSELRRNYGAQLEVYADAVRKALELDRSPRKELWLLRSGEVLALDDTPGPDRGDDGSRQLSLW